MKTFLRKRNRLAEYDYSQDGAYFITLCTQDKKLILGNVVAADALGRHKCELTELGELTRQTILTQNKNGIRIESFVIMPNHIHMIIVIDDQTQWRPRASAATVGQIVSNIKSFTTKQYGSIIWQKSFHDRVIRHQQEFETIWHYIDTNPDTWKQDMFYSAQL